MKSPLKHSFFLRLLSASLIILLLALGTGYGLNAFTVGVLEDKISESNYVYLEQVRDLFDGIIGNTFSIFTQLAQNNAVQKTISENRISARLSTASALAARRQLNQIYADYIDDLFIYYSGPRSVISRTHATLDIDLYMSCYYPTTSEEYRNNIISSLDRRNFLSSYALQGNGTLMIMQSIPFTNSSSGFVTACLAVNRQYISELFRAWTPDGGALMLVDGSGSVVMTTNAAINPERVNEPLYETSLDYMELDNERYVMQVLNSSIGNCHCVSVIPQNVFYRLLNRVQRITFLCFIGCAVICFTLALFAAQRASFPIKSIIREISARDLDVNYEKDIGELDYIQRIIKYAFDEKDFYLNKAQDRVLRDILENRVDPAQAPTLLKKVGIDIISERFCVILLYFESDMSENFTVDINETTMSRLMEKLCPQNVKALLIDDHDKYICLLNCSADSAFDVSGFCHLISRFFADHIHMSMTVASGSECKSIAEVSISYRQAKEALSYYAVRGPGAVIEWSQLKTNAFQKTLFAPEAAEKILKSCILRGDPAPSEALSRIRHDYCNEICLPDEYKCYFFDMIEILRHVVQSASLSADSLDTLNMCNNLVEFEASLINTLEQLCVAASNKTIDSDIRYIDDICSRVCAYIDENYYDSSLSITLVGEHFGMSGQYLSQLLKENRGVTISARISDVRIDSAKQILLNEPRLTLEAVSLAVALFPPIHLFGSLKRRRALHLAHSGRRTLPMSSQVRNEKWSVILPFLPRKAKAHCGCRNAIKYTKSTCVSTDRKILHIRHSGASQIEALLLSIRGIVHRLS